MKEIRSPERYWCESCGLSFEVGTYHSHEPNRSLFFDNTLVVCTTCGTQYRAHHQSRAATQNNEEEFISDLLMQPEPIFVTTNVDTGKREIARAFERQVTKWQLCLRLISKEEPLSNLEEVTCCFCSSSGTLVKEWGDENRCPSCGHSPVAFVFRWMT
jgi:hypothetical protein